MPRASSGTGSRRTSSVTLEPVDHPGQAAARQEDPVREVGHAQPMVGRLGELHQHVVGRDRQISALR